MKKNWTGGGGGLHINLGVWSNSALLEDQHFFSCQQEGMGSPSVAPCLMEEFSLPNGRSRKKKRHKKLGGMIGERGKLRHPELREYGLCREKKTHSKRRGFNKWWELLFRGGGVNLPLLKGWGGEMQ